MKKRLFCFLLTLCLCFSFPLASAAREEDAANTAPVSDFLSAASLIETNSPVGAVAIAYDLSSRTTRYYGISGNVVANVSETLTVPGWFPETQTGIAGETAAPDNIIGNDNSIKVTDTSVMPYSAVLWLISNCNTCDAENVLSTGTAFMISPNVAMTAAHCVYHTHENKATNEVWYEWPTSVAAIPGLNGLGNGPFGFAIAYEIVIPVQYYESRDENYDWALIRFTSNIGNKTGFFGYQFVPRSMEGINVTLSGYPFDDREEYRYKCYYQWRESGALGCFSTSANYDYVIHHKLDTLGGQSGSPLFRYYDGAWTVVAIHTRGETSAYNQAVRFTSQMFSFVHAYRST